MKLDRKQIEADFRTLIGPLCDAVGPSGFEDEVADLLRPAQEGAQGRGRRQQGEKLDDRTEKISDTVIHTSSHYPAKRLLNARGIARTGRIF